MLLRLFNFIYFQCIISMGLPSAPVPPQEKRLRKSPACRMLLSLAPGQGRVRPARSPSGWAFCAFFCCQEKSRGAQGPFGHHKEEPKRGSSTDAMGASDKLLSAVSSPFTHRFSVQKPGIAPACLLLLCPAQQQPST